MWHIAIRNKKTGEERGIFTAYREDAEELSHQQAGTIEVVLGIVGVLADFEVVEYCDGEEMT